MTPPRFMGLAIAATLSVIGVSRVSAQSTRVDEGESGGTITSLTQLQRRAASPTALDAIPAGTDLSIDLAVSQDAGVAPATPDESSTRGGSARAKGMPSLSSLPMASGQLNGEGSNPAMGSSSSVQSTSLGGGSTTSSVPSSARGPSSRSLSNYGPAGEFQGSGSAAAPSLKGISGTQLKNVSGTQLSDAFGASRNQQSRRTAGLYGTEAASELKGQSTSMGSNSGSDLKKATSSSDAGGWEGFERLADPLGRLSEDGFESPGAERGWETACGGACSMHTTGMATEFVNPRTEESTATDADQDAKTDKSKPYSQILPSRRGRSSRRSALGTGLTSSPSRQRSGLIDSEREQR